MSFEEAIATQPDWVRAWVWWMSAVMVVGTLVLIAFRSTRRAGLVSLAAMVATFIAMQALYGAVGYVRLLGLPHVAFWTPLLIYLALYLRRETPPIAPRIAAYLMCATMFISLLFDVADVVRYALGERGSLVPGA